MQDERLDSVSHQLPPTATSLSIFSLSAIFLCFHKHRVSRKEQVGFGMMSGIAGEASFSRDDHFKAEIASHPLFQQLLSAHLDCLHVATPTDHRPIIRNHHLLDSSPQHSRFSLSPQERLGLDTFMGEYLVLLSSLKDQLERHVKVDALEALMACRQIQNSLQALTGVTLGEASGATMSDDEDEYLDLQLDHQSSNDTGKDMMMGFGLPTESERTLMETVRQELKIEFKQGFRAKIEDVREEIMRKRRAGKLPGDTTSVLKNWWQQHSKWPYPTEDDKAKLVEETGLQLKQINNWFINQRKRNWHIASQSATSLKSKRRR